MNRRHELAALEPVIDALNAFGVEYYIGGSIASSVHGMVRTTVDVDVIADLTREHVPGFVARLENTHYIDSQMVHEAIRARSSFNVIHLETSYKIDVFPMKRRPFDQSARQRTMAELVFADYPRHFNLASPEDTILNKLEWYRMGGEVSERQWLDVLGVMKVQGEALDRGYLQKWAVDLGVTDLLERAWREAAT